MPLKLEFSGGRDALIRPTLVFLAWAFGFGVSGLRVWGLGFRES